MNREKAIRIFSRPQNYSADAMKKAIEFAIDFLENHKEPENHVMKLDDFIDTFKEKGKYKTILNPDNNSIKSDLEGKIYSLVHTWCDEQAQDIPDQNRRYLMDAIVGMIDPQQDEPSEGIEAELIGVNLLNNTLTFQYGQQPFELKEGKYLIKRIDQ